MTLKLQRLKRNKHMLHVLKHSKPKLRKAILSNADDDLLNTINEIAYNTLQQNNPISSKTKSSLKRHKHSLRRLACPKQSLQSKKKLLIQKGDGFLPILLGTVLSGVIGHLLNRS